MIQHQSAVFSSNNERTDCKRMELKYSAYVLQENLKELQEIYDYPVEGLRDVYLVFSVHGIDSH